MSTQPTSANSFTKEELKQIFSRRIKKYDEIYNSAESDTRKILINQMMVRYIQINKFAIDEFASEVENYIASVVDDPPRQASILSLVTDLLTKSMGKKEFIDRYKDIIRDIVYMIAESKKPGNIDKARLALNSLYKRGIYPTDYITDLVAEIERRSTKNSKDILQAANQFLNYTNELCQIKKKRLEVGEDPKNAREIKQVVQREINQRNKFIEFHTQQMSEISNLLDDLTTQLNKYNATVQETNNSKLLDIMATGISSSSDSDSSDSSSD